MTILNKIRDFLQKIWMMLLAKIRALNAEKPRPAVEEPPYIPTSLPDLLGVLKRTPKNILSTHERQVIAAAMSFGEVPVSKIMLPESEITFVKESDVLGPLMLDKLYKSGFAHFPILKKDEVAGILHTSSLNSLEIKETDQAGKYLDARVFYMRSDYSLEQALAAFLRTNCYFFLVINRQGELVGQITYDMLVTYLLGRAPKDNFDQDLDRAAVQNRQ